LVSIIIRLFSIYHIFLALVGYKELLQHEKQAEEKEQGHLSVYQFDKRKVSRGFSLSNFQIIQDEREEQKSAVSQDCSSSNEECFKDFGLSAHATFVLPDISTLDKEVAEIIKTELISKSALAILTKSGISLDCMEFVWAHGSFSAD